MFIFELNMLREWDLNVVHFKCCIHETSSTGTESLKYYSKELQQKAPQGTFKNVGENC